MNTCTRGALYWCRIDSIGCSAWLRCKRLEVQTPAGTCLSLDALWDGWLCSSLFVVVTPDVIASRTYEKRVVLFGLHPVKFMCHVVSHGCICSSHAKSLLLARWTHALGVGCPRNSADSEFRGIFWLLKWFLRNSGEIPRNSAEFRRNCTGNHFRIPRNSKMSLPWTP